jgi:hypothetical protein
MHPLGLNHSKHIENEGDIVLKLERGLSYFFKNFKANCHSSSSRVFCIAHLFLTFEEHL